MFASVLGKKSKFCVQFVHGVDGFGLNTAFAPCNQSVAQLVDVYYEYNFW